MGYINNVSMPDLVRSLKKIDCKKNGGNGDGAINSAEGSAEYNSFSTLMYEKFNLVNKDAIRAVYNALLDMTGNSKIDIKSLERQLNNLPYMGNAKDRFVQNLERQIHKLSVRTETVYASGAVKVEIPERNMDAIVALRNIIDNYDPTKKDSFPGKIDQSNCSLG